LPLWQRARMDDDPYDVTIAEVLATFPPGYVRGFWLEWAKHRLGLASGTGSRDAPEIDVGKRAAEVVAVNRPRPRGVPKNPH